MIYWYEPNAYATAAAILTLIALILHLLSLIVSCVLQRTLRKTVLDVLWICAILAVTLFMIKGKSSFDDGRLYVAKTCQQHLTCPRVNNPLLYQVQRKDRDAAYRLLDENSDQIGGKRLFLIGEPCGDVESLMGSLKAQLYLWDIERKFEDSDFDSIVFHRLSSEGENNLFYTALDLEDIRMDESRLHKRRTAIIVYDPLNTFGYRGDHLNYNHDELLQRLRGSTRVAQDILGQLVNSSTFDGIYEKVHVYAIADKFLQQDNLRAAYH